MCPFLCVGRGFKCGCRAASPLAAVAACGGGKVCGRDESLPYRLNRERDLAISCGPGMPGPYRAIRSLSPRGFGALGGAQRAPPASKADPLLRLLAPQGQALLTTPVSLRSTVAPCSQPRTPSKQRQFSLQAFFCCQKKATFREAPVHCLACSAASRGGISCFLRLTTPGSFAMQPSGSTWKESRMMPSASWP